MAIPPSFVQSNQVQDLLNAAIGHHRAGNLAEAEKHYRQLLSIRPNHPDALHLLGILAGSTGHIDAAIDLINQAIKETPAQPIYYNTISDFLRQKGRLDESVAAARKAIELRPNFAEAYNSLCVTLMSLKRTEEAVAACQQAVTFAPNFSDAFNNLCVCLKELGRFDESIAAGIKATQLNPNHPLFWFSLGNTYAHAKKFDLAVEGFRKTVALNPNFTDAYYAMALALVALKREDEALIASEHVVRLNPDHAEVWNNLGLLRWRKEQEVHACIEAFKQAVRADPKYSEAHYNLGLMQLVVGDYENGWAGYEYRWETTSIGMTPRNLPKPRWDAEPLNGRTILLHAEQGSGDTIQFARYVPIVAAKGGRIVLGCQPSLNRLMVSSFPDAAIVPAVDLSLEYDVQCPLMSLPLTLKTRLDSIPNQVPYLKVDPALVEAWSKKLSFPNDRLKVGIAWAGARSLGADEHRSLTLAQLAPLARAKNVTFYSLQKGPDGLGTSPANSSPAGMDIINVGQDCTDFADTAAVISQLDLVISVDTSVAHLAGAFGRPTWVLVRSIFPEWRWLLTGETSPWYPTVRLFRQPIPGDWRMAIENVAVALEAATKK